MSRPDAPCTHCGAFLWMLGEDHDAERHFWVPVYRCRECLHAYVPEGAPVLVGAD